MNSKRGVQSKRKCESHEFCVCIGGFSACGCQKKSDVLRVLSFGMEQHTHSSHSVDLGFRRFSFMDNFKKIRLFEIMKTDHERCHFDYVCDVTNAAAGLCGGSVHYTTG